jgi:hypothetical protein
MSSPFKGRPLDTHPALAQHLAPYGVAAPGKPHTPAPKPTKQVFSPHLSSTPFNQGSKLSRAFKALPAPKPEPAHHSLFSLHTLEKGASDVGNVLGKGVNAVYGRTETVKRGTKAARALEKQAAREGEMPRSGAMAMLGFARNPVTQAKSVEQGFGNLVSPEHLGHELTGMAGGLLKLGKDVLVELPKGHPGAAGKDVLGIGKSVEHVVTDPFKAWSEEPLNTMLIAGAPENLAGTAAGGALRAGVFGDRAAQLASLDRAPIELPGGLLKERNPYSTDVFRKGATVAGEKLVEKLRGEPITKPTGRPLARHYTGSAVRKTGGTFKRGLVDLAEGDVKAVRQHHAQQVRREAEAALNTLPKAHREAVPLAVEGTIRRAATVEQDLRRRLHELGESAQHLTGKALKKNAAQQDQIGALLLDEQFLAHPQPALDAAAHIARVQQPLLQRKIELGAIEPAQEFAKAYPFAFAHRGARYVRAPGPHPIIEVRKIAEQQIKKARQELSKAVRERDAAKVEHPSVASTHPVAVARRGLREAELGKAETQGRLVFTGLRSLGREARLKEARGRYHTEKADLLSEKQAAVDAAQARLTTARQNHKILDREVKDMKRTGHIKPNGEQWPGLFVGEHRLRPEEVYAHASRELEGRPLGFLTHKENEWGQAMHARTSRRPAIENTSRTGTAYKQGTYDSSLAGLYKQLYKDAQDVAGHEGRDAVLRRFSIGGPFDTPEAAQKAKDQFEHTPEGKEINDALGNVSIQQIGPKRVVERGNVKPAQSYRDTLKQYELEEHNLVAEKAGGKYVLVPEKVVNRLAQHDALNNPTGFVRGLQQLRNFWSKVTLYSSFRWPIGTTQENAIRLAMANVNPLSVLGWKTKGIGKDYHFGQVLTDRYRQIMVDPHATEAEQFMAHAYLARVDAGTVYGSYMYNSVHREGNAPIDSKAWDTAANVFGTALTGIGAKPLWTKWTEHVGQMLRNMETRSKTAMFGKVIRNDMKRFGLDWRKVLDEQNHAMNDYFKGTLTVERSAQLGERLLDMAGNWTHYTPGVREAVQTFAPFSPWWLNSVKFIFHTLPAEHPMKAALLAALSSAIGPSEKNLAPWLRGGISFTLPALGRVTATPGYYSPLGIGEEPVETATGMVVPNLIGPPLVAAGINPLGFRPETGPSGKYSSAKWPEGVRGVKAAEQAVLEYTPFGNKIAELIRGGGKEKPGAIWPWQVEPGSNKGEGKGFVPELLKTVSPIRLTRSAEPGRNGQIRGAGPIRTTVPQIRGTGEIR